MLALSQATQWWRPLVSSGTGVRSPAGAVGRCIPTPGFRANGPALSGPFQLCFDEYRAQGKPHRKSPPEVALLLHGSPADAADLARVGRALSKNYRVIALDLPGSGRSGALFPDYGIRAAAKEALFILDRLGVRRVLVFAHSLGAGVALEMARIAPERLTAIVSYGGVGSQEGEGSGSYSVEHFKYSIGFFPIVVVPELLPHFGLLGSLKARNTLVRNFMDTDMRPLSDIIRQTNVPILILHGAHDPLVPLWAAEHHYRLTRRGKLIVLNDSHFLIFSEKGSARIAEIARAYFDAVHAAESGGRTVPRGEAREPGIGHVPKPPIDLGLSPGASGWARLGAIIVGTFVSEDLTCIATGLLIRQGVVDLFTGLIGCYLGIFLGDLGLFFLGRLLRLGLVRMPRLQRPFTGPFVARLEERFAREGVRLLFLSRFVPGMRLPVYVGAGLLGGPALRMVAVALLAGVIWTPMLVIVALVFGPVATRPLTALFGENAVALLLAAVLLLVLLRVLALPLTRDGRRRLRQRFGRLIRSEFWPPTIFYAPLVPVVAALSLRYRGFSTLCAANPGIPEGGFIGESKLQILDLIPAMAVLPYFGVPPGEVTDRVRGFQQEFQSRKMTYPLILKPDVAQRGIGLRLCRTEDSALAYIREFDATLVAQSYHPGPFEAGVFYVRFPSEAKGRIFSITDKVFPVIEGDGRSTLEDLIHEHPRYFLQADTFLRRFQGRHGEVLPEGKKLRLAIAGNHIQGTLFRDGGHLLTPQLEAAIDSVATRIQGFYFGRFDLRYSDTESFCAGREIAIVELNGATAESTNIFDPQRDIWFTYGTLFRQWKLLFAIGHANRKAGAQVPSLWHLLRLLVRYRLEQKALPVSD